MNANQGDETMTQIILQIISAEQVGQDADAAEVAEHCQRVEAYLNENTDLDATVRPVRQQEIAGTYVGEWRAGREHSIRFLDDADREPIEDAIQDAWNAAIE
jgi:hypothetical protein